MASKFCLASGIPERRIRPIWDAVDSRQYKAALKLSIALLTKYPKSPYAIALKALILERLGKTEDALSVCLHAKERLYSDDVVYIDDLTLSTLHIVFQRLNRLDLGTSCYEYACGKFPNNLELMIGLFNCYVREYSFVKQQQTAIKMYKIASEERFLLWSVCSIQLQVLCGNGGEKLLLLAEGLLKKHVVSHSLHEPEALLVYVSVLEQQAKYGAALEILSEKLGSLLVIEVDKLRIEGRLLARACDYAAAAEIFKRVLELCPDDWECFLDYLACLLEDDSRWSGGTVVDEIHPPKFVTCKLSHLTHEVFDSRISEASQFVQNLQTEGRNDFTRCPYLATLEIERRKRLFGKIGDAKLMDGLVDYFCRRGKLEVIDAGWLQLIKVCLCGYIAELHSHGRWSIVINIRNHNCRFGHLACFTTDVEAFLQVLTHDEKMEILGKFVKSCGSLSTAPLKVLGQSITIFKIQELFGSTLKMPLEELECTAVSMAELYCKNLPLSKDLDLQENMHGEDLLCMASNLLVQLFWRTRHLGYLLEAILVLEFGLTIRRHISQYKISLLHLYSHLSALPLAHERYKTLEVKNILLETISHHILPQMMVSPLWSDLSDLLKDYLKFMDDYSKESADLTFLAYRHRNYSKVIEFVQFKERLENSHQYLMSRLETAILQLKQKSDDIEEEECILESLDSGIQLLELSSVVKSKSLTFNEDTESRPWWTPTPDKNYLLGPFEVELLRSDDDLQKQTKEREVKVIERRSLVPRMIYLCIQCASSSSMGSSEANGSTLGGKNSLELKSLLERYATNLGLCLDDAVETIVGVSTSQQSFEVFGSEIIDWMNLAVFVDAQKLGSNPISSSGKDEHVSGSWSIVNSLIEKYTVWKLGSMQPLIQSPGSDLHLLVQLVSETMAWQSLVLQSCIRSSFPSGRKKRKIGPTDQLYPLFQSIQNSIQAMYGSLVEMSKWLKEQMDKPEDEYLDLLSSYLHKEGPNHGPGQVLHVLESLASSSGEVELGDRIFQSLSSWNSADSLRKTVVGQRKVISEFHIICESKLKLLQKLKHQM